MQTNPFSTRFIRPGAIPFRFAPGAENDAELDRIALEISQSRAALIVGPHGTGKSTLLQCLRARCGGRQHRIESILLHAPAEPGMLARTRNQRRSCRAVFELQRKMQPQSLLIIDGIEQLSSRSRRRLVHRTTSRRQRILATSHTSFSEFRVVYQTSTTPQIIDSITSELLENQSQHLKTAICEALDRRERSTVTNLRELLFDLYDLVADLQDNRDPRRSPATRF